MSTRAWVAFAAVSTLWRIPYLLVVAVALGVAILGERPGAGAAAGLQPILAGRSNPQRERCPARHD